MTPKEFVCWLDGALSVNGKEGFNPEQTQVIRKKLSAVDKSQSDNGSNFCNWMQGYFDMVEPTVIGTEVAAKLKEKLDIILNVKEVPVSHKNNTSSYSRDVLIKC